MKDREFLESYYNFQLWYNFSVLLGTCKKLNWPKYQQKIIKKEKNAILKEMVTKRHMKSYFLFKQKFILAFNYTGENIDPKMYIKKGISSDVIEVTKKVKETKYSESVTFSIKKIVLLKSILKKIAINVASKRFINTSYFYGVGYYSMEQERMSIAAYPNLADKRYFVLENIYTPNNSSLFFNIQKAEEEIELLSENQYDYKMRVFLLSFTLFFLERFHDYILNLLKDRSYIKIQLYEPSIKSFGIFDVFFDPFKIPETGFIKNTKIISESDQTIKTIDSKINEVIEEYKKYITTTTNKAFDPQPKTRVWVTLYDVAVNAFIAYVLAYLYHIIDLEKISDDLKHPKIPELPVKIHADGKFETAPVLGIPSKYVIHENSLLRSIMKKIAYKIQESSTPEKKNKNIKHFFVTEDNRLVTIKAKNYKQAMIDFLKQNETNKNDAATFLFFVKEELRDVYSVLVPISIENFFMFFRLVYTLDNNGISKDFVYKLAHNTLYKNKDKITG